LGLLTPPHSPFFFQVDPTGRILPYLANQLVFDSDPGITPFFSLKRPTSSFFLFLPHHCCLSLFLSLWQLGRISSFDLFSRPLADEARSQSKGNHLTLGGVFDFPPSSSHFSFFLFSPTIFTQTVYPQFPNGIVSLW